MGWGCVAAISAGGCEMKPDHSLLELQTCARQYMSEASVQLIARAYDFAKEAHEGQVRMSGDPFIQHPLEVAYILAELEQDPQTVSAALLHDTIEDSGVTPEQMTKVFGADICQLVEGVTKLGRISFQSKEEEQAENFRKMFLAMAKDLRVVIIKLADRLHNMRTLKYMSPAKQVAIARETREIFSPLAHRLGMWSLKWELEDLAFYYLQPDDFQRVKKLVASRRDDREDYVDRLLADLKAYIEGESKIPAKISGRPKHFYSIYKKLTSQNLSFDELYDTLGIRIIVASLRECYEILGLVHARYRPLSGRFKDYIAMPKTNMYQSLHTTVIGPEGKPVEIQIRTRDMHYVAESGIAAHWRYKEGASRTHFDGDFAWLRQILESEKERTTPSDFLQNLKLDLFIDEVFVFTPKGDVQVLPKGSTPLDFAYKIHTEIGHRTVGAKVNSQIVPLGYVLQSGERLEILTTKVPYPKMDWLRFVHTRHAKAKIKQWFKKQGQQKNLEKGREKLEKLVVFLGYLPKEVLQRDVIDRLLGALHLTREEELYLQIAEGELGPRAIETALSGLLQKTVQVQVPAVPSVMKPPTRPQKGLPVMVMGETGVMASLAKCCDPVSGEAVVGYVTVGYGVSVHRADCKNVLSLPVADHGRLVAVEWIAAEVGYLFSATLHVEAFDRIGILQDIIHKITDNKINIEEVKTKTYKTGGRMRATVVVNVTSNAQLQKLKSALSQVGDVYAVKRN
jgi:guanosine-3',5'-bis(diphosphate) 3'-pyrophosphohydrolase